MSSNDTDVSESSPLLDPALRHQNGDRTHLHVEDHDQDVESMMSSHISRDERALQDMGVGERLPYNDYTTIDWLHDLVGDLPLGNPSYILS